MAQAFGRFWRNSREWSLGWQLIIAVLFILLGSLVAAVISDALYGSTPSTRAVPAASTSPPATNKRAAVSPTRTSTTRHPQRASTTGRTTTPTTRRPTTTVTQPEPTTTSRPNALVQLTIAAPTHEDSYNRDDDFGGWVDIDGCKDTRAELLIRTSSVPVTFTRPSDCTVATGRWTDPWSGVSTTAAHSFQIDHTVPLANAWRSGAWSWSHDQRVAYANDLTDTDHLVPILSSENESKGDSGPDEWKPPSESAWCTYALVWDHIKAKWHLSATQSEWNAVVAMAETC